MLAIAFAVASIVVSCRGGIGEAEKLDMRIVGFMYICADRSCGTLKLVYERPVSFNCLADFNSVSGKLKR